jgi:hypothetical protein
VPIYKIPLDEHSLLVRQFAQELGWKGLERTDFTLYPGEIASYPNGVVGTGWTTTHLKFFVQINQETLGSFGEYAIAVCAERFDISQLDFVQCSFTTIEQAIAEARRLAPQFARANFRDSKWRRRYLEEHPERLTRPKKKWRGWKGRLREVYLKARRE